MRTKFLIVVNDPAFFATDYLHIGRSAAKAGYEVHLAGPEGEGISLIEAEGFEYHRVGIGRGSVRPLQEIKAVRDLYRLYSSLNPDLVYHITLKPIVYGTLAARWAGVPAVVNAYAGLGYAFIDDGRKTAFLRQSMESLYRFGLKHENRHDLFLNEDDRTLFLNKKLTTRHTSSVISGPGVDMKMFRPMPEPQSEPVILLAARMLWHKGVEEFVEAAHQLLSRGIRARFVLVGEPDAGNEASISRATLQSWHRDGVVEWWGPQDDMQRVFAQSHVVVLPSYREGLGKELIEGAACGRPLVATDVPGCREVARDGHNALLVPPKDSNALASAMEQFIENRSMRQLYGRRGRVMAESAYSIETVCHQVLELCIRMKAPERRSRHLRLLRRMPDSTGWTLETPVLAAGMESAPMM